MIYELRLSVGSVSDIIAGGRVGGHGCTEGVVEATGQADSFHGEDGR